MNATVKVIGLDIAKNVFVAVGVDEKGKALLKHKLAREEVLRPLPTCLLRALG